MPEIIELTPEQELDRHFKAMDDSVALIEARLAGEGVEGLSEEDVADDIERNARHLEIMLEKEEIAEAGRDLSSYEGAIAAARA